MKERTAYAKFAPQTAPWLRRALACFAVTGLAFVIYVSNGQTLASYDSAPNSLLAFNLLENHRLDLDSFRGSYFSAMGGGYAFVEAPNGHLTSAYPIGPAIVSLPIYCLFYFAQSGSAAGPAINTPAFEPLRQHYEKTAAAVIAALSVGLFLLCAREIGNPVAAGIATAAYALATPMWSTGSQALWQHGPVNLFVLAMVFALFRAGRARDSRQSVPWLVGAGIVAGFLPVIRPTAILFTIAGLVFAAWTFRRNASFFAVPLALGVAPGLAWNAYFFHSLIGGYAGIAQPYSLSPARALPALAGLLMSPSRGLFTFSPVLLFAVAGAVRAGRVRDREAMLIVLLATACVALVIQYAFFRYWWAGFVYGPRFLTDVVAVAALALIYVIPAEPLSWARRNAPRASAFALLFCYSLAVQFVGLNSGAAGSEWNAVPISVDVEPERVWPITDNQIERNVRAAYFRYFAWNIASSPEYDRGAAVRLTGIAPALSNVAPGAAIDTTVTFSNEGASRIFGYDTGVYVGQLRLRVRIIDAKRKPVSEQYLYVRGAPATAEGSSALGAISMPKKPGTYELECDPVLVGAGPIENRGNPLRVIVHVR